MNWHSGAQVGSTAETVYHDEPNNYWVKNRSQIDADKWAETITYFDGLGRAWKSEEVNSQGNIFVEKEFDAEGRVKRVTNPFRASEAKIWTTNVYDEASRVKEVLLPDGAKVLTDYGVSITGTVGVTKQITDQVGKKRKGITDALGRMIRVIEDPTGQNLSTDYVFDTLGNLRKTTQGEQNRYFMHDSLGRLLRAKQPEQEINSSLALTDPDPVTGHNQWSVGYSYDNNGNIITTTDARNISVTGTYDHLNRITIRNYSDSTPDVQFFYDGRGLGPIPARSNGKTTKVTSVTSETRYTSFDELGRLETHQQITDDQTYSTEYSYNLSGALIEETYPSGRKVKNTLDVNGDLSQVQSRKNANYGYWTYASGFAYNTAGAVRKMQLGNGRWETASYNDRTQIEEIGLGATDSTQDLLKLELDYGTNTQNNGSLREQKITVPTVGQTSGFTAIQTYTYDNLNRIESAKEMVGSTETWKQTFIIDLYGNRRFNTATGLTTTLGTCTDAICNPEISTQTNRFTTSGYGYDKNGNVTQDAEGKQFIYDAENHQTEVKDASNVILGEYLYDGEGRRVKKVSNIETTIFVYNASGQLVAEYSTQMAQTPQVSYLTTDHLGSPRVITDQNGAVTSRKDFSVFGDETITAQRTEDLGYKPPNIRQDYTGYQKDDESGLEFAQARYYNPTHGRFTSVDPLTASASIKNPQTFNRYSYVLNSPYKYTDPLGLLPATPYIYGDAPTAPGCGAEFSTCPDTWDWGPSPESHTNEASDPPATEPASAGNPSPQEDNRQEAKPPEEQDKPFDPQSKNATAEDIAIDRGLAGVLTDTGIVRAASSARNDPPGPGAAVGDSHYRLADGKVHTVHIYANEAATSSNAGVYIPKEFSDVKITSKDTVVARNPKSGEVLLIAHVQVGTSLKGLRKRMKSFRENGTVYIGQIGGKGGASVNGGVHAHLSFFPSEKSRLAATAYKADKRNNNEYTSAISRHLADFRKFVKK